MILEVHEGKIVKQGNHEELVARRGIYYRMQQTQMVFDSQEQ